MSAVPISHRISKKSQHPDNGNISSNPPVLALKELVARLHQEQYKVQNLLTSLGFALRSFNNLNQFLELIPLIAARVADAEASVLIQVNQNNRITLEHLYCQENFKGKNVREVIEKKIRHITTNQVSSNANDSICRGKATSPKPQKSTKSPQTQQTVQKGTLSLLDAQLQQSFGKEIKLYGTPILVQGEERGRLYIFSHDPDYEWTTTREKLVQLVADQTAVAIANNELTLELRKKERMDRELEIASEIQLHLLPRQCPKIQGVELAAACQTANRVGGDYYDFIPANYDQYQINEEEGEVTSVPWSIVIGDVMGKGVPAGLIMTMTRGMLRAEVLNRHSPARILEHLNRVMYTDLENSHRFVTLFYSEYNPETGVLSFSNAAHNPPLWWRAASGKIQRLDAMGMLVGLEADSEYEDNQVQLSPGDTVIYYTDGFTDAVNSNGDRFDEENLIRTFQNACQTCLSPQSILEYLFNEVQQFIGLGNRNSDDMTLVVMQVKSSE